MTESRNAREEREIIEFLQRCAAAKPPHGMPVSDWMREQVRVIIAAKAREKADRA